jgi:hypothetical protein
MGRGRIMSEEKKLYWATPKDVMDEYQERFNFDFDPCPNPRPEGFDGLEVEWGNCNWVNPPFTGGVMKWVRKAIEQQELGKTSVIILPIYQSRATSILTLAGADVEFAGLIRWECLKTGEPNPCKDQDIQGCLLFKLEGK